MDEGICICISKCICIYKGICISKCISKCISEEKLWVGGRTATGAAAEVSQGLDRQPRVADRRSQTKQCSEVQK